LPDLDSLPELSAYRALSAADNVPTVFERRFLQFSSVANEYYTLNPLMSARVAGLAAKHGLDKAREVPTVGCVFSSILLRFLAHTDASSVPQITLPWRRQAQDGVRSLSEAELVRLSCRSVSPFLSRLLTPLSSLLPHSGNITLHCETALQSLSAVSHLYPLFNLETAQPSKPRILLMTAESDALATFQADPVCKKFEIVPLRSSGSTKSFVQADFAQLTAADRLEDARVRSLPITRFPSLSLTDGDLRTGPHR
jgi:hypothetical protein